MSSSPAPSDRDAHVAARDHDGLTPVFLFAHDYGTHLPYCEILGIETSIKCTCGFKEALEAALASEEAYDLHDKERLAEFTNNA